MENQRKIKEAFNHTFEELEIPNILSSLQKGEFENLRKAHNSIHEFIYLAVLCVPFKKEVNWHSKSAFLLYHNEAFDLAHRSSLEALAGYYNAAYSLLRSTLELLLKGAFWECLAHKEFRNKVHAVMKHKVKIEGIKRTLIDWFEDIFQCKPSIEEDFEKTSAAIYDKIFPIPEDPELKKLIPIPKKIIEQLSEWGILDPISRNIIYEIYTNLSADVHVIPNKTDIGRRLLKGEDLFETTVILDELNKFFNLLHEVMDIGIVIELNVLNDWIQQNGIVKDRLKERLSIMEKDLQLNYASSKIRKLVGEK